MTDHPRGETLSIWGQVDALCDEFEKQRLAGERGDIECFLQRIAEPGRMALVRELVLLDASYVRRGGADIDWGSYESQFPQFSSAIQEARRRFDAGETKTVDGSGDVTPRESANMKTGVSLPRRFGHYELRGVLGRGAFGTVYRAYDTDLDREVALKIPRFHALTDERDVERFLREARAAAQLKHPSIATIFEVGEIDGQLYIACELIEGTNLRESLASGERPTYREATMLLRALAQAVHAAHSRGIIHRDLKPANVLLDADGTPHIADFGLARQSEHDIELTSAGMQLGTPAYMSPEQATGHSHLADARSDLWSLGVIFYELLTGRRPFEGSSTEVIETVCTREPIAPRSLDHRIPRDLETICLKCLQKDPEKRYPSAQHLADDLERWSDDKPIVARRTTALERVVKFSRRNPARVLSMGLAGSAMMAWWIYLETRPAFLDVRVVPATATATLDGTPVALANGSALVADAPGHHELEIAAEGYLPQTHDVTLARGKGNAMLLSATLESSFGYFRLDSIPTGAGVTVERDGQTLLHGTTPFHSERLPAGEYEITLEKELYRLATLTVEVPTGDRLARLDAKSLSPAVDEAEGHKQLSEYRDLLARNVEFPAFRNTPLQSVRQSLIDATKLSFHIDARALEESGISASTPVTSPGGKMSLRSGLRSILGALDLTVLPSFQATGDRVMLLITTRKKASTMMITTYFPLGKLLDNGVVGSPAALISMITSQVVPQTWDRVGGSGSMAFHPDVRALLVSATWDTQLNVMDLIEAMRRAKLTDDPNSTKSSEGASLQSHTAIVWCIAVSPDGKHLASTSGARILSNGTWTPAGTSGVPDDTMRVWNIATGREAAKGVGHSNIVKGATFSCDGKTIFTASADGSIREWDAESGEFRREFPGEPGWLNSIVISSDGKQLLTAGSDGHARLWSVEDGSEILRLTGHTKGLWHAMFRPEYAQVASVAADGTLRIWDLEFGEEVQRLEVSKSELQCVDFSPDGNRVIVGGTRGVQSWDLRGAPTPDKKCEVRRNVRAVRFLPGARSAIVACDYGVLLLDTLTGTIAHSFEGPIGATQSLCLLPDGRFAAGGHDGVIRIRKLPE